MLCMHECVYVLLQQRLHPKTLNTLKPHQNREGGREREGREGREGGREGREGGRGRERERGEKMKKQKGREK